MIWSLRRRSLLLPVPGKLRNDPTADHPTAALEVVYQRHLIRRREQRDQLLTIIAALNEVKRRRRLLD